VPRAGVVVDERPAPGTSKLLKGAATTETTCVRAGLGGVHR
jgi:hypothetical protein